MKKIKALMDLNDTFHESMVNVPGLPMKYNKKTKIIMAIWTLIFSIPFLTILILAEILL